MRILLLTLFSVTALPQDRLPPAGTDYKIIEHARRLELLEKQYESRGDRLAIMSVELATLHSQIEFLNKSLASIEWLVKAIGGMVGALVLHALGTFLHNVAVRSGSRTTQEWSQQHERPRE